MAQCKSTSLNTYINLMIISSSFDAIDCPYLISWSAVWLQVFVNQRMTPTHPYKQTNRNTSKNHRFSQNSPTQTQYKTASNLSVLIYLVNNVIFGWTTHVKLRLWTTTSSFPQMLGECCIYTSQESSLSDNAETLFFKLDRLGCKFQKSKLSCLRIFSITKLVLSYGLCSTMHQSIYDTQDDLLLETGQMSLLWHDWLLRLGFGSDDT